VLNKAHLLH